ncbi:efflux RND transporter permease subunit, partial [Streptomyces sp. S9]|nr:efflux RND transporter permease subunit [Streptomyces sp. S9]
DVAVVPMFDLTQTVRSGLHEVEIALLLSVAMVAAVMLAFLRRLRPTLIAMLSVSAVAGRRVRGDVGAGLFAQHLVAGGAGA